MHALPLVNKSFTLAVMVKSFTLAVMMGFVCLTAGQLQTRAFGDVLHLVRPQGNLRTRAVVMVLTLSGFSDTFSIIWSNSSLMVIPGKRPCPL